MHGLKPVPNLSFMLPDRSATMAGGKAASYALLAGALLAPGLWLGPTVDAAAFVLVGSGIRSGGMPYRDYWDVKPPGVYLMNAASQAGLPWLDPWLVSWLLTLVLTVVAAIVLESLLRPRVGAGMAWVSALVSTFFVTSYATALGGGYAESYALPFVLAALWILSKSQRGLRAAVLTGCFLSAACLVSLQAIPAAVAIGFATCIGKTIRSSAKLTAILVVAGLTPALLAFGWLVVRGAGAQAYDALVGYNAAYRLGGQGLLWLRLVLAVLFLSALLPSVVAQVAWWLRRIDGIDRVSAACAGWIALSVISFFYGQRIYLHYLILVAPAMVIIGAAAFVRLSGRLRSPNAAPRRVAVAAQGWAVAMLVVALLWGAQWTSAAIPPEWHADQVAVSSWLRANTPASASMFVWGNDTEIYLNSDRRPACPYLYLDPLTTRGYWSQQATDDLLARFKADPPEVVVETPSVVPLFRPATSAADDPRTYDVLAELRTFVRDNYWLAHTQGLADVWMREN